MIVGRKIKLLFDYVPYFILIVYAIILLVNVISGTILLQWKHYVGFTSLLLIAAAFYKSHRIGILCLGTTLLTGLFGLLSFSPAINIFTFGINAGENFIPLFYGQPIFILLFGIHFIISRKYYYGIGTKKYWQELKSTVK